MKIYTKKSHVIRSWFIVALLTFLFSLCSNKAAFAGDISVYAQLSSETFSVNESVLLTIKIQGANSADLPVPTGKGLEFTYRDTTSQMQWINGKTSSNISFFFMVQSDKLGEYKIEPIKVSIQGKKYESNSLSCTVLPAASSKILITQDGQGVKNAQNVPFAPLQPEEVDKISFMRITPDLKSLYLDQVANITINAYFKQGLRITIKNNPHLHGNNFIFHSFSQNPVQKEKLVNGEPYVELAWKGTLSAKKEGNFPLEFELDASLFVQEKTLQAPDPNPFDDDFLTGFLAQHTEREFKLTSPKKSIIVRNL